jgi:hypothetical protein
LFATFFLNSSNDKLDVLHGPPDTDN